MTRYTGWATFMCFYFHI